MRDDIDPTLGEWCLVQAAAADPANDTLRLALTDAIQERTGDHSPAGRLDAEIAAGVAVARCLLGLPTWTPGPNLSCHRRRCFLMAMMGWAAHGGFHVLTPDIYVTPGWAAPAPGARYPRADDAPPGSLRSYTDVTDGNGSASRHQYVGARLITVGSIWVISHADEMLF